MVIDGLVKKMISRVNKNKEEVVMDFLNNYKRSKKNEHKVKEKQLY